MKRVATVAAFASALLVVGTATAQEQTWLRDRQYREGAGFVFGDFELHPGIGADVGYDSNYFYRDESENPVGSVRIRISPHFAVSTLGPQRRGDEPPPSVAFRFEVGGTYNEFIPTNGGTEADQDTLREQRNFGGQALASLDILPGRVWGGNLHASIGRTIRPTNEGDLTNSFNRILPTAGAELIWTPGSGLLDWRLGYEFSGTFFESSTFSGLNNYRNDITTRGRWRFLPRTALIYDASFGFITYPDAAANTVQKTDSHPMRARLGLNGLVTNSFAVLGMVGWGASFYAEEAGDVQEDFDSVLALAELKWFLAPPPSVDPTNTSGTLSSIAVGFTRNFEDSYIGTYLEHDMGYVKFSYLFGGRFLLVADARAGAVIFPPQTRVSFGPDADDGWTDVRVDGTLFGEWRIKDWLGVNAEVAYTGYFSDTTLEFPDADGQDEIAYQVVTAFAGVRVFW